MKPDEALNRTVVHPESTVTVVWIPAHVYAGHFIPGRLRIRVGHVELHGVSYETAGALSDAIHEEMPSTLSRELEDSLQVAIERKQAERKAAETLPASEPAVEGTRTVLDGPKPALALVAPSRSGASLESQ